ncbi:hypothetical protein DFQ28_004892, partial [Apophysomyces sp. BC1034]
HEWFKHVKPTPDWVTDTWQIRSQGREYVLSPSKTMTTSDLAYLISHRQIERIVHKKHAESLFMVLPGLPPDHDVKHVIDTGDALPISHAPFKMSPLELDEL